MKTIIAIIAIATLSGCAAKVVSSSPRTVIVNAGSAMAADASKAAEAECAKHKRYARLAGKTSPNEFVFDCVE